MIEVPLVIYIAINEKRVSNSCLKTLYKKLVFCTPQIISYQQHQSSNLLSSSTSRYTVVQELWFE
ncbi:hypothetical protein SAMN05428949_5376 [Chitinophaga sp. YR627]|nr:hypothetical protein SAMN05428949_5376 [Chitinophaga sp. YR627]